MSEHRYIDPFIYGSAHAAQKNAAGTRVGILVRVGSISRAYGDPDLGTSLVRVQLIGQGDGKPVEAADISTVDNPLFEELLRIEASGLQVIARGRFGYAERTRKGQANVNLLFEIEGFETQINHLTLIGATAAEAAEAEATFARLQGAMEGGDEPDALARHLIKSFHWLYGIMAGNITQRFRKLERLTLLQALSGGDTGFGIHNMRLSTYFTSSPGRGKRVLVKLAKALAPVSSLAQPSNLTEAGLCARVEMVKGGPALFPGAIPRANRGTCIIEDVSRVSKAQRHGIFGALVATAEDGELRPLKSAETVYQAQTALHLNGNPASKVTTQRPSQRKQDLVTQRKNDLGIPLDLFSRLHVVANLDSDEPVAAVSTDIAAGRFTEGPPPKEREREVQLRKLQVLVSYVLDRLARVDLDPVAALLGEVMEQVAAVVREATAQLPAGLRMEEALDEESICLRMANALRILVAAEARLRGRAVAKAEDVAVAASMISMKVEVLRWLAGDTREIRPLLPLPAMADRAERLRALRWDDILLRYGGQEVSVERVADELGYTDVLVRREMAAHGVAMAEGVYRVPTLHAYVEGERAAAAARALLEEPPLEGTVREQYQAAEQALQRLREQVGDEEPDRRFKHPADPTQLLPEPEDQEQAAQAQRVAGEVERGAYERPLPVAKSQRQRVGDGILPLSRALARYAEGLVLPPLDLERGRVTDGAQVAERLMDVVLFERPGSAVRLLAYMGDQVEERERYTVGQLQPQVTRKLCDLDWTQRGLFALSLYLASPLPSVRRELEIELLMGRGRDMPAELRRAVKATINRLKQREAAALARAG